MKNLLKLILALTLTTSAFAQSNNEADRFTVAFTKLSNIRFITAPIEQLKKICGDEDGCQIRLSMSNYNAQTGALTPAPASASTLLFLNTVSGQWRTSEPTSARGAFGNNSIEHVLSLFNKCYLTDGYYKENTPSGDKNIGLSVMYFGPESEKAGCAATFID